MLNLRNPALKNTTLLQKLLFWIIGIAFLGFGLTIGVITYHHTQTTRTLALENMQHLAKQEAGQISLSFSERINAIQTIANTIGTLHKDQLIDRTQIANILKNIFERYPDLEAVWLLAEPNAIGQDARFVADPFYDKGRLTLYYAHDINRHIQLKKPRVDYQLDYDTPSYTRPKNAKKEFIAIPHMSQNTEKAKLITSISVPIVVDQAVIGVIGVDIALETLQQALGKIRPYQNQGFIALLAQDGTFASHLEPHKVGKRIQDVNDKLTPSELKTVVEAVQQGKMQQLSAEKIDSELIFVPLKIGNSVEQWSLAVIVPRQAILGELKQMTALAIGMGAIALILIGVIIFQIIKKLVHVPLTHAIYFAEALSNGDLTTKLYITHQDEMGVMLQAMEKMQQQFLQIIDRIKQDMNTLGQAIQDVFGHAQQVTLSSQKQCLTAVEVARSIEQMTVTMDHIANNSQEAQGLARQAGELSTQELSLLQTVTQEMQVLSLNVTDSAQVIHQLSQQAESISSITDVIKEIAEQTNLLALNAAIEAARAGEAGRGFSIVATEVRKLAEKTADSTNEISKMIGQIQTQAFSATECMTQNVKQVQKSEQLVKDAEQFIHQIKIGSEQVIDTVYAISSSLMEQNQTSKMISGNIEEIAVMSEQNEQLLAQVTQAMEQLSALSVSLQRTVEIFKLPS